LMDFISNHMLTTILLFPVLAAVIILFLPKEEVKVIRWAALIASLIPLALGCSDSQPDTTGTHDLAMDEV